jgi:hypothetical protein
MLTPWSQVPPEVTDAILPQRIAVAAGPGAHVRTD